MEHLEPFYVSHVLSAAVGVVTSFAPSRFDVDDQNDKCEVLLSQVFFPNPLLKGQDHGVVSTNFSVDKHSISAVLRLFLFYLGYTISIDWCWSRIFDMLSFILLWLKTKPRNEFSFLLLYDPFLPSTSVTG
jgi:hypothetical protein